MARDVHRSLVRRGGRKGFVKDKGLAHTKENGSAPRSQISKRSEQIEFPAKLLDYF
jgi:hypothetical protein